MEEPAVNKKYPPLGFLDSLQVATVGHLSWFGNDLYKNASLFSKFCQISYLPKATIDNSIHHVTGWRKIAQKNVGKTVDDSSEKYFRCHVFQDNTDGRLIVFAFRGTLLSDVESLANIWGIACGSSPDFLHDIYLYIDKFLKENSIEKSRVYLCGHSLGGYIANMLAIIHGFNSVSFDSPGLNPNSVCDYNYRYNKKLYKNIAFVSHPNFINCFGKQYFDLYYIASNIDRQHMVVQNEVQKEQWMLSLLNTSCSFGLSQLGYPNILESAKEFIKYFSETDLSALLKSSHTQFKLLLRTELTQIKSN